MEVKGCPVELRASGGIIGYILTNDLLRKQAEVWVIQNEIKWVEEHDYAEE